MISKKSKGKEEKVVLEEEVNDKGSVINIRFRLEYEDSVIQVEIEYSEDEVGGDIERKI